MQRIDGLVEIVDDTTDKTDKNYIELDVLTDLVVAYEKEHFLGKKPATVDAVKFHRYEMKKRAVIAPAKSVKRVAGLVGA